MALNARQMSFITQLKQFASNIEALYGEAHELSESFLEEFDDGQDHSFLVSNADLEAMYFMSSADVKAAVNQAAVNFINYWVGSAVTTREYGKDIRRVK